ncbi:MAG TPA: RdgB/HAM1 family non-canonical purine NTP pyrophosphatase [Bacteroidales bacterium]|nr:RdgB/HAM1 family non-canonical purine NTP pyrophosphatase [Bacteroidales bacterium]
MQQLIFATHNQHKVIEVSGCLNSFHIRNSKQLFRWQILSLRDIGCYEEIPETSDTLEGNALLKARFVKELYNLNSFADDTGLEIEALGGRPGVYSARYAGNDKNFDQNISKVLGELHNETNRKGRFRTVFALMLDGAEYFFEGTIDGEIIRDRRGTGGFGYDSIFIPVGYSQTFAQMSLTMKNSISHRYQATEKLAKFLLEYLPSGV